MVSLGEGINVKFFFREENDNDIYNDKNDNIRTW